MNSEKMRIEAYKILLIIFVVLSPSMSIAGDEIARNSSLTNATFFDYRRHCIFNDILFTIGSKLLIEGKLHQCTYKNAAGMGNIEGAQWENGWEGKFYYYKDDTIK